MNKIVTIYAIVRMETGEAYVGSTIAIKDRWRTHRYELRVGKHHCMHLRRAWAKYGEAAFDFLILHEEVCASRDERLTLEGQWIATHGTYNTLVPSDRAGIFMLTPEARERRSQFALEKIKSDPAYARRLQERGAALAALARTSEARANMAVHSARRWQDPKERERLASGQLRRWGEEAAPSKEAQSERMTAYWADEAARQHHGERLKAQWADPNSGLRNRSNGRWADPEAKARQAEKIRAAHDARRGGPKQPKPKKPKPVTMGDLILAEMRSNPSRIYMPSELRRICDPEQRGTSTLVTVTLGRLIDRGFVRKITQGEYGYQLV